MALVSYDVSDASDYEEDDDSATETHKPTAEVVGKATETTEVIPKTPEVLVKATEKLEVTRKASEAAGKAPETPEVPEDSELFSVLPTPKTQFILDSDLTKKLLLNQPKKQATQKVKITLPLLSEFEEDLPTPTTKKIAPSTKGSGLFAMLPPPKNTGTLRLIPDSVKKPIVSKTTVIKRVPLPRPPVIKAKVVEEEEEDEEDTGLDFLGLNKPKDPEPGVDFPMPELKPLPEDSPPVVESVEEVYEYEEDVIPVVTDDLALDEEALQKLCGGSRRKRTAMQAELIDVAEKDVRPDKDEWMLSAMKEEKRTSSKKSGGPGGQTKRKHQITYLAFQAKANEQDLQTQWASNRMTKKQTQSKYGF